MRSNDSAGSDVGASGNFYVGSNADIRFSADGIRCLLPTDTSPNIPTASQAIRWFPSGTGTWDNSISYAGLITYKNTSTTPDVMDLTLTSCVGNTDNTNGYSARVVLQAGHYASGVYTDANIVITREAGAGGRYIDAACDTFYFSADAYVGDDIYIVDNCSALTYTDRTPFFDGDALAQLRQVRGRTRTIKGKATREIDHATIPAFARKRVTNRKTNETHDERDLGAMISLLTVAVQQLDARLDALEGRGNGRQ